MNIIDSVFNISNEFMKNPKFVNLDYEKIEMLANTMKENKKIDFLTERKETKVVSEDEYNYEDEVKLELLASSINYCYWYGKPEVKLVGSCSTLMYALLVNEYNYNNRTIDSKLITNFVKTLVEYRFTLLEDRIVHLEEAYLFSQTFAKHLLMMKNNLYDMLNELVTGIPGMAADLFLKRAISFFMQLNRKFKWFANEIEKLPIPAGCFTPQLLRNYGCITYQPYLDAQIQAYSLIPKGSLMECEIRAASIKTCNKLSELTGWTSNDIDTWLFTKRNECSDLFHLTTTTDY